MRHSIRSAALAVLIAAPLLPAQQTPASTGATIDTAQATVRVRQLVETIAAADSIDGRRDAIVARLRAIGLEPRLATFDPPGTRAARRGTNVIARVPGRASGASRTIL